MFTKIKNKTVEVQEVIQEVKDEVNSLRSRKLKRTIPDETNSTPNYRPASSAGSTPSTKCFTSHLTPYLTPSYSFNTELCVDLKTILISDRRAKMRKNYTGVLTRGGKQHYTFMEDAPEKKIRRRYPCVYQGGSINVHKRDDGTLYPTFRHPGYTRYYTFRDFCREAAEELLLVGSLVKED